MIINISAVNTEHSLITSLSSFHLKHEVHEQNYVFTYVQYHYEGTLQTFVIDTYKLMIT